MKRYYSIGDLELKFSSNRIIGTGRFEFKKFSSNSKNINYEIECTYTNYSHFNKLKSNKSSFLTNYYISKKNMIYVKKDFKKKKIEIIYARNKINENGFTLDIKYKIIANLRFLNSQLIIACDRIMLHGAGLIRNGKAYIFLAPDEGGKTTLIKRNRNYKIINDDQIFYSIKNHQVFAHATPFGLYSDGPANAPIVAFFYINKAQKFSLLKRDNKELINTLLIDNREMLGSLPKDLKKKAFNMIYDISFYAPVFEMQTNYGFVDWDQVDEALKNT